MERDANLKKKYSVKMVKCPSCSKGGGSVCCLFQQPEIVKLYSTSKANTNSRGKIQ